MIIHVILNCSDPTFHNEPVVPTIQEAYDHLKAEYKKGNLGADSEICIHAGDHYLEKPLCFDSDFPVTIRNYGQGKVNICGGRPLTGWTETRINGRRACKVSIPETVTDVPFLFVDGKMATAARWPKKGYFRVTDECPGFATNDDNCDSIHIRKGDFDPEWHDPENIRIHLLHLWIDEPLRLKSYDRETYKITLGSYMRYVPNKSNTEYLFLNVREALSGPNEYYFDRSKHEIILIPERADFEAVLPTLGTLVNFLPGAKWITLSGLDFKYAGTHWPRFPGNIGPNGQNKNCLPEENTSAAGKKKNILPTYSGPQGAPHVPGVILFRRAGNCNMNHCTVSACAWYGIQVSEGCNNITFSENEISGMGGGGFTIGGGDPRTVRQDPSALTSRIIVRKNHIHDCGSFFHSAIGVLITHACGCLVDGNHIHDLFYSGISCGWTWGYGESVTRENCICRNHIHDLGKGILSDMGGIYLLGIQPGTHVFENVIHDIVSRYYGGWGLYADEGASHLVFERNLVYGCACEGFEQNYGRENIVRHNIFAFNKAHGMAFSCDKLLNLDWPCRPHGKIANVYNNVILTDGTPVYCLGDQDLLKDDKIYADGNIIFDVSGKENDFAVICEKIRISQKKWREKGNDSHSVFGDPGFRNMKRYDFRLKKNSILWEYGFGFLNDMLKQRPCPVTTDGTAGSRIGGS